MTSAIHDIGYRHYDGPRLGRGYVRRSLYLHNLRAAWGLGRPARSKVLPFLLAAIVLLPALGSVAIAVATKMPGELIRYSAYAIYLQVVVAIFLATQAPVLASRDLRFHVVPLYFSRPVGHLDFVLAKLGAMATALFVLLAAPVITLYIGSLIAKTPDRGTQALEAAGALVGCAVFALVLASLGLVIAAFTARRGLGVAAVIAFYMISTAFVSMLQGIAEARTNFTLVGWLGLLSPFNLVDIVQVRLLGAELTALGAPSGIGGGLAALAICVAIVALAIPILGRRYRKAGLS
ncbi:ABC transporter permease [Actinomadura flavalba]|uniref:ABC transporter permease n=1 Tax=Actinomadura flavalba TaxID=1120938 RepID=UPI000377F6F5|nr:ABC transporter permease [Actinomadura flavalba]